MQPSKKKLCTESGLDFNKKGSSSMSEKQRSLMLEFLSENPSMVLDRSVGGSSIRPNRDELWEKLALILNSCGPGAQKDGSGWRRSWQDLKRYESLKAKESMSKIGNTTEQSSMVILSPLQEKIAYLLNESMTDVAQCINPGMWKSKASGDKGSTSRSTHSPETDHCSTSVTETESPQGVQNSEAEVTVAQALQSIATALTERNAIEERKLTVYKHLLTAFMTKSGIGITDIANGMKI